MIFFSHTWPLYLYTSGICAIHFAQEGYPQCAGASDELGGQEMRVWPAKLSVRKLTLGPDEIPNVAPGARLRVDRLLPTDTHSTIAQIETPGHFALDLTDLVGSISADGAIERATTVALLVERGDGVALSGHELGPDCLVVFRPGTRIRVSSAARFTYLGAVMPDADWIAALEHGGYADIPPGAAEAQVIRLSPHRAAILRAQASSLAEGGASEAASLERFEAHMQDFTAELAAASMDARGSYVALDRAPKARQRQANAARDHIVSNIRRPISVSKLPRLIGASRRQLEYAFRDAFGLGPREFIHVTRLNEIRRELLSRRRDDVTVTEIAFAWGINHLGRFAASYRQLFGESPAETLVRADRRIKLGNTSHGLQTRIRRFPEEGQGDGAPGRKTAPRSDDQGSA